MKSPNITIYGYSMLRKTVNKYSKCFKFRQNQRNAKEIKRLESYQEIRESYYEPPSLRGLRIYGDLDMGYLKIIFISLWSCGRIDSYYVRNEDPRNIGKRPKLEDEHLGWWADEKGNKKKYGKVNLDKAIREMMPNIRRFDG